MGELRVAIRAHDQFLRVLCCLCGAAWDEQFVSATLAAGPSPVGQLCPRCLSRPPSDAAARLRALWAELQAAGGGPPPAAPAGGPDDPGERVARLRREGQRLRSLTGRVIGLSAAARAENQSRRRGAGDTGPGPGGWPDALLLLAERLAGMAYWGVTVRDVMHAEQVRFLCRYGCRDDRDVRRAVDDRYRAFLAAPA